MTPYSQLILPDFQILCPGYFKSVPDKKILTQIDSEMESKVNETLSDTAQLNKELDEAIYNLNHVIHTTFSPAIFVSDVGYHWSVLIPKLERKLGTGNKELYQALRDFELLLRERCIAIVIKRDVKDSWPMLLQKLKHNFENEQQFLLRTIP